MAFLGGAALSYERGAPVYYWDAYPVLAAYLTSHLE